MSKVIMQKLNRAFTLYKDLIEFVPEEFLSQKIPNIPSNELGHQLWCVIGARYSYLKALKKGSWQGFESPLDWSETYSTKSIIDTLNSTALDTIEFLNDNNDYSQEILLDLLEHEIQHQGQIIRYLYAFKVGVPESWKKRYNLD